MFQVFSTCNYPVGRGGQKFLERCVPKVAELRARFPDKDIEVDGGVGPKTIHSCAEAGTFANSKVPIWKHDLRTQGAML